MSAKEMLDFVEKAYNEGNMPVWDYEKFKEEFSEKTAKEMFEKLEYTLCRNNEDKLEYWNNNTTKENVYINSIKEEHNNGALPKKIIFWKDIKCIDFEYGRIGAYLYFDLLQAINKQIEELGWCSNDE